MGMEDMFTFKADFSSLVKGNKPLNIAEVKHKAFLNVNEEGTEAGAATCKYIIFFSPGCLIF